MTGGCAHGLHAPCCQVSMLCEREGMKQRPTLPGHGSDVQHIGVRILSLQ